MLRRVERKLAEVQRWVDSVYSVSDWPAAVALALLRTRPSRDWCPGLWIAPDRLGGLRVRMDPGNLSHFTIYEEIFMNGLYDLGRVSFVPDAIIDCGAFQGYFSLLARVRFADAPIVAFEPDARNFAGLIANLERNHAAIAARAEAVSTSDGSAQFSGAGCGGRLGDGEPDAINVTVADLRRVINELKPARLLLKLDIEGEEARLLPALLPVLPRQCAIFFEWHHGRELYRTAAALLAADGFSIEVTRASRVDDATVFIDAFAQRG